MLKFKPKPKPVEVAQDPYLEGVTAKTTKLELLSPHAELVDEVGQLTEDAAPIIEQIAALQLKLQPLQEKKVELQKIMDELGTDDEPVRINGSIFRAEGGKRGTSRSIKDMDLVKKHMGTATFMQIATVKLGDIDKYLTGPQRDMVLQTARTSRSVKVGRKP